MKKIISVIAAAVLVFALAGCSLFKDEVDISGKYTYNSVISMSAVEENSTDKIKVSYTITISGDAADIANLKSYEVFLSDEAEKLLIETGEETSESGDTEITINGSMIFDTSGKSKDEINSMVFVQGVKITDKDGNKGVLKG